MSTDPRAGRQVIVDALAERLGVDTVDCLDLAAVDGLWALDLERRRREGDEPRPLFDYADRSRVAQVAGERRRGRRRAAPAPTPDLFDWTGVGA